MAHTITIPDVGDIDFPDSMSDADIAKAASNLHASAQFDRTKAQFEAQPSMSMGEKILAAGKNLGSAIIAPLSPILHPLDTLHDIGEYVSDPGGVARRNLNPQTASALPGAAASNPLNEAVGNLELAVGSSAHEVAAKRQAILKRMGVEEPAAPPKSKLGVVDAIRLVRQLRKLSPGKLGDAAIDAILDHIEEVAKPKPPVPPAEALTPTPKPKGRAAATPQPEAPTPGQPSAEMLRRAGIPLSAEEEALAQHIMEGVEPEPKPIKPNVNPAEGERSGSNIISGLSHGEPGISITSDAPGSRLRRIVYRDTNGTPQGYLQFYLNDEQTAVAPKDHGLFPEVFVAPGARRTGIATQLYDAAKKNGFDLSGVSGTETTPAGAAFLNKRAGVAPVPPPADFESIPLQGPAQGNVIPIRPSESPIQPGISLPSGQGAAIPPEVPGLDAQRAFAEAMTGDPSGGQIPAPASPHPPAEAFEAAYRAKRAQVLADHFHQNGISYEDLQHLTPGDLSSEQWEALLGKDPDTGVQFREPSQATIDQARVFLAGKSAAARSPKALAAAKELAGVGPKGSDVAPKADSAVEPAAPSTPEPKPKARAKAKTKKISDLMNDTGGK